MRKRREMGEGLKKCSFFSPTKKNRPTKDYQFKGLII